MNEPLHFNIKVGGEDVFRAVCKCAINFYIYNKGNSEYIKNLIPYVVGQVDQEIVWFHYQDKFYNLPEDECFHLLHLVGDPNEKILYCYVDYFNVYKYIVLLNAHYLGEFIQKTYCYDIISRKEKEVTININYERESLLKLFKVKDITPHGKLEETFNRFLWLSRKRQNNYIIGRIVNQSYTETIGKHSEGNSTTKEMMDSFFKDTVNKTIAHFHRIQDIENKEDKLN